LKSPPIRIYQCLFAKPGVPAGPSGRPSNTCPVPFPPSGIFLARARRGRANTDPSADDSFNVSLHCLRHADARSCLSQCDDQQSQPTFVVGSAPRSGPLPPSYLFLEISTSASFLSYAPPIHSSTGSQTTLTRSKRASAGQYSGTSRADADTTGPFSECESFSPPALLAVGGYWVAASVWRLWRIQSQWNWHGRAARLPGAVSRLVIALIPRSRRRIRSYAVFEMTSASPWLLRGAGFGWLHAERRRKLASWNGGKTSPAARIVLPIGHLFKCGGRCPT